MHEYNVGCIKEMTHKYGLKILCEDMTSPSLVVLKHWHVVVSVSPGLPHTFEGKGSGLFTFLLLNYKHYKIVLLK